MFNYTSGLSAKLLMSYFYYVFFSVKKDILRTFHVNLLCHNRLDMFIKLYNCMIHVVRKEFSESCCRRRLVCLHSIKIF